MGVPGNLGVVGVVGVVVVMHVAVRAVAATLRLIINHRNITPSPLTSPNLVGIGVVRLTDRVPLYRYNDLALVPPTEPPTERVLDAP